ncbi:MAG: mechanosensitive ion channel [Labilithrix sp.]|nr:mechanosensitive ion channel [Labilithrix sp.]MCW5818009.1 mechanosensitive ion channel [Labilithrix sp.]
MLAVAAVAVAAWLVEVVLRRRWNPSRRRLMEAQLLALRSALVLAGAIRLVVEVLEWLHAPAWVAVGAGFVAIVAWMNAGLRVARVFVFQWLFAGSEREGVPALLVDVFTVAASVVVFGVLLHAIFLIEVTSLLATSAVLSVVLGLALQDTLGQLLAGISLQLDRPFRLGDWVEVLSGSERISGQVLEVSWRATLLLAIGEELVTIPNKTMAQGLVLNFSGRERPFVRGHFFRVPLDADLALVKKQLTQAALETKGIAREPAPVPLVIETTESWIMIKMINFIDDYGAQFNIGDAFQTHALELLAAHGVELAAQRVELVGARGSK